jgi:UDP-GlcNAc:undecaprenyl-phosphate GlcNAc-1-phosphate transferase
MNLILYVVIFIEALVVSLVLTPVAMRVAKRTHFLDHPNQRKVHRDPIPYLGGAAIFFSFVLVVLLNLGGAFLVPEPSPAGDGIWHRFATLVVESRGGFGQVAGRLAGFLAGGCFIFIVGLIDDRSGMSAKVKLATQFIAAGVFCLSLALSPGSRVSFLIGNPWLSIPLLLLWMVAVMNSFNFIDNMDGLAGGVAAVSLFFFCAVSYLIEEQAFLVLSYLALLGAVLGFLRYNWNPARIFMGDAGSLFLGYSIAALAVLSQYVYSHADRNLHHLSVFAPVVILSVPIFDTTSVILIRLRRGLPIWQADKNHFSHRLVAIGLTQRDAVLLIHLVVFCTGLAALLLPLVNSLAASLILLQMAILFTVILMLERAGADKQDAFFAPLIIVLEVASVLTALFVLGQLRS